MDDIHFQRNIGMMYQKMVNKVVHMVLLQLLLAIDLITKLLTIDSQKRITTAEALNHPWMKVE
jgi:serine/threonine protein kinase